MGCLLRNILIYRRGYGRIKLFFSSTAKDGKPRIEIHPVNTISPIRKPLRLDCVVVGVPPPVVLWLHNSARVHNTSNRKVYPNGSLVILSLSLADNGHYSCNGTNNKGSVSSSDISVNVACELSWTFQLIFWWYRLISNTSISQWCLVTMHDYRCKPGFLYISHTSCFI